MRHAIWTIVGAAIAMLVCANPADAAITGAGIATSQSSYHGACPVTIQFTGSIAGKPGTGFTYSFNRFVDGVQHVVNEPAMTMPSGAIIKVSDSITISSSTSGVTFDQIWVHNIAGGQPDLYSKEAHFTVICGAPPKPRKIFAPTKLANTVNASVCGQHGGFAGLFCPGALHDGFLVLVWDYPAKHEAAIDGYHVYHVGPALYDRVDTQSDAQATIAFLKPVKGGFAGLCYQVTAFEGKRESKWSNQFCVSKNYKYNGPPAVVKTYTLPQTASWCKWQDYTYGLGQFGEGCGPVIMGYMHMVSGASFWLNHENEIFQTILTYDASSVKGMKIFRATMTLTNPSAQFNPAIVKENYGCYGGIGIATAPYTAGAKWIPSDSTTYPAKTHFKPESSSIDVTRMVQAWAAGKVPNYGFVFHGLDEDLGASDNNICVQYFDANATLTVEAY
jgi:hypothetical protein